MNATIPGLGGVSAFLDDVVVNEITTELHNVRVSLLLE